MTHSPDFGAETRRFLDCVSYRCGARRSRLAPIGCVYFLLIFGADFWPTVQSVEPIVMDNAVGCYAYGDMFCWL